MDIAVAKVSTSAVRASCAGIFGRRMSLTKTSDDPRRCSKCGADVEETYTARICQGCGELELFCECEKA